MYTHTLTQKLLILTDPLILPNADTGTSQFIKSLEKLASPEKKVEVILKKYMELVGQDSGVMYLSCTCSCIGLQDKPFEPLDMFSFAEHLKA